MRFTAIKINNFRQYESLSFEFPKTTSYDLHIIVADNGVGKTNILNAITWCLYEKEPHLGNESKSLPKINLNAKMKAIELGMKKLDVSVKLYAEDGNTSIIFSRNVSVNVSNDFEGKSELTVLENDGSGENIHTGEEATAYVNKYMPQKIQQYFYFDGEQLDSYFISDESTKIKETIHSISQVDIVTRVKERLGEVISAYKTEAGKKAPNIKKFNDEIQKINSRIENLNEDIRTLKEQISISKKIIQTNAEKLRGQENVPELERQYEYLQEKKNELEQKVQKTFDKVYKFIRVAKISLSFYKEARITLDIIEEKEAKNALPPNIDKKLLQSILASSAGNCVICGQKLSNDAKSHIQHLIDQIQVSSETSNILMRIKSELEHLVKFAEEYSAKKKEILQELKEVQGDLEKCEQNLQDTDLELRKFSDKEQVIRWHTERSKHERLLNENTSTLTIYEYQKEEAEKELQEVNEKLSKALSKEEECKRLESLINFANDSKNVVAKIEEEMMQEVRTKMEMRTMGYFDKLIWKKGIYDYIVLDEKYQLDLIHRDGYPCVGSCSAAERSLLALAFTLALHEVSGFNSLLFIDTPVARVSGENRYNFANVLKEVSRDKQLILAFTPDEYSENIQSIFSLIASSSVHLRMKETNDITIFD